LIASFAKDAPLPVITFDLTWAAERACWSHQPDTKYREVEGKERRN
jgi:hypothetical protein